MRQLSNIYQYKLKFKDKILGVPKVWESLVLAILPGKPLEVFQPRPQTYHNSGISTLQRRQCSIAVEAAGWLHLSGAEAIAYLL